MEVAQSHTGLPLGLPERASAQRRRKEVYRQELLQQMGQQASNRRKEKELDLKVAASGAVDPEKEPGRLREFSAVVREPQRGRVRAGGRVVEEPGPFPGRAPYATHAAPRDHAHGERPGNGLGAGGGGGAGGTGGGDELRGSGGPSPFMSWDMLALMMSPRAAAPQPAPPPPHVTENMRTPYDDAYFFYGAHDPLEPGLAHRGRPFGVQQHPMEGLASYSNHQQGPDASVAVVGPQRGQAARPHRAVGPTSQLGSDFIPGSADRGKQRAKHQRYQEELEDQMHVEEVRRQREREDRERYESRIEQEARAFSPWGKGGGGAPLRDPDGNLITDLKQMHKRNEEAYKNPHQRPRGDARAVLSLDLNLATPRTGMGAGGGGSPHKYPGFGYAYRGALHAEPVTEQQARAQGLYKDFLKQQIEEKRRREAEERAHLRAEEEREERRLQHQRDGIRAEYEQEQARRQRHGVEHRAKNEEVLKEAEEKLRREAEERRLRDDVQHRRHREESARAREQPRGGQRVTDSPPVPALMKERRHSAERRAATPPPKHLKYERPDTASSVGSTRRHPIRDGKEGMLSELSYLRQQLRSERQQLEGELRAAGRASPEDQASTAPRRRRERERPRSAVRVLPPSPVEELNFQNLRDFHDLKYRVESPSRTTLRRLFPEPATDAAALELQQTTLLGEQQRKLHALQAQLHGMGDYFPGAAAAAPFMLNAAPQPLLLHGGLEPQGPFAGSMDDGFIMADPADAPRLRRVSFVDPSSSPPGSPPAAAAAGPLLPHGAFSVGSTSSLNVERIQARNHERLRRLHGWDAAAAPGEESPLLIRGRLRPGSAISADSFASVATEPWLRPGSRGSLRLDLGVLSTGN